jgi:hypothetical protein
MLIVATATCAREATGRLDPVGTWFKNLNDVRPADVCVHVIDGDANALTGYAMANKPRPAIVVSKAIPLWHMAQQGYVKRVWVSHVADLIQGAKEHS